MTNIIEDVKQNIINLIKSAIQSNIDAGQLSIETLPEVFLETPKDKSNGDFACTVSMQLAKMARQAPRKIAEAIAAEISKEIEQNGYVEKLEIAGAGFINFYLSDKFLYEALKAALKEGSDYGKSNYGNNKKVMVEFISANPTGPMHMGNARGGALGDVMAEVLAWSGHDVTREFYLNDAGNQIEKFKKSLSVRYLQEFGQDIEFPDDGYQGQDIIEHAKEFIKLHGDKYLKADEEERRNALLEFALPKNIEKIRTDLASYGINYDVWFSEKSLYESGEINETLDILKQKGYTYEVDGTLWLKSSELGGEKDEVIVRGNGIPTYFAGDIAYHRNKFLKRGFDRVIDIWGADHHGHVARMKGAMDAVGCNGDNLEVVLMQLVRLLRGGEVARMSKRTGTAITLSDLIDEIGVDAARFFFNTRSYSSHLDFDLDLAVKKSNENPVYYVQYAHARICQIIKQAEMEGTPVPDINDAKFELLTHNSEIELMKKIAQLPEEIKLAANLLDPSKMTRYAIDIAEFSNTFYNACHVRVEDVELMKARLSLIEATRIVLSNVLGILGVSAPEKM